MGKVEWGNEVKRQEYDLAYANDMILLEEDERGHEEYDRKVREVY